MFAVEEMEMETGWPDNQDPQRCILIVEDNRKTSQLLSAYLEREGFHTIAAFGGREALALAKQHRPALVVLDVLLPDFDGWEICERLRQSPDPIPILMISALGEAHDRIKGLTLGADDYMVKPFSFVELVARVQAILRRVRAEPRAAGPIDQILVHDELCVDICKRRVTLAGVMVSLTRSEFRLLQALMKARGKVFTREELLHHLYPDGGVVIDRVVDVHIGKLRQKIEPVPSCPQRILTARGLGYHFAERVIGRRAEASVE